MKDDLRARVRGLDIITWKGCDWVELLVVRARRSGSGMIFLISREQRAVVNFLDVLINMLLTIFHFIGSSTCRGLQRKQRKRYCFILVISVICSVFTQLKKVIITKS